MISSSNFFKKTFFTLDQIDASRRDSNQPYGPWSEESPNPPELFKRKKCNARNRYSSKQYLTISEESEREKLNKSDISKSLLLSDEHSLIAEFPRGKSFKLRKNKIISEKSGKNETRLPTIKINDSQADHLKKNLLKLEGNLLNFITTNNQRSLKKFVSRKEEGPRFEIYRKCLIAARRMVYDGQQNSLFYNQ